MPIFVMRGLDGPEGLARRPAVRPSHLEHLRELERLAKIMFAGPIFAEDGSTPIGSIVIFESDDLTTAQSFCARDPYVLEGVFGQWDVNAAMQVFPEN
ncbi:MAG: YciI family protein [Candidatus Binatia bacterium]|nr:YciI family protein [Candidatus Binatia bacterium]MDG2010242.1 YciI family protein [Candidatus Binatia bacterium]